MKKLVRKFGKYNVATFIIMGVGLIIFALTPLLLWLFEIDSDIVGFLIFLIGLVMWVVGLIVRLIKKVRSNKGGAGGG
jgi:phosphoglycerol transferase MdoB-like AlkP superfamily enzyme